ncbi:Crp/Fnr family transcriptional regulator [Saccharopolyspora sp. NPDC002376]
MAEISSWPNGTLLGKLEPKKRNALLKLGVRKTYGSNEKILFQGEESSHVVLLLQGVVKVTAVRENGAKTLLAVRFGGDLVGEMGVLEKRERSATVTSCIDTVVRRIESTELERFLSQDPMVALQITRVISERLRWANDRRIDFAAHDAETRVVRVLLQIAETYGRYYRSTEPREIPLCQEDLATLAGARLRTTQSTLRKLETQNVIERGYRKVMITNPAQLHAVMKKLSENPQ